MNFYFTNPYTSKMTGQLTRNIVHIMTQEERLWLADCVKDLEHDRDVLMKRGNLEYLYTKQGTLAKKNRRHINPLCTYWIKADEEAIEFLKRLCYFGEYPESVMLDPLDYQLETIVDKMLVKIYGRYYGTFARWSSMEQGKEMNLSQLKAHMNDKRKLCSEMKELGMIPKDLELPY